MPRLLSVEPELVDGVRRVDLLDRPIPHRLTGFAFLGVFLRAGLRYKLVPQEFWAETAEGGLTVAEVACPCGHSPQARVAAYPTPCECERWFFFDGTDVWALNTPEAGTA